ncbi:hypothetical protein [Flavobacterium terrisoli]|uniref:hypothetical protein n=1 Tax=Flavobacterium terrisoli TaxID=3242195 RepID=UPI00254360DF|nr:hypothetical protein [Flavobacterium buctense]
MNYSVSALTQISDCDALLTWANKEKADLNFKKLSDERLTVRYAETAQELDAVLQGVLAELAATETIIAVLPDGPTKDDALDKKTRLEYKKFLLETRRESYGAVALLEKEMDLARVNQEITEVDSFITAVTNHKATLS